LVNLLRKVKRFLRDDRILKNIFKTSFQKSILISYTVLPFFNKKETHTNNAESRVIARIFNALNYNVDVIHYTNQKKLDYSKYDLIFGFGESFENSFIDKDIKRIYYATGAHVCHQNYAEIKRIEEVNIKYNSTLLPKRLVPWNWSKSTSLSDALVVIGNEWTKSTYTEYTNRDVYSINATALINSGVESINRDIEKTKKSFLWFGSSGLVHKGLDLCLEFFRENKNLTLHVCGPMEDDFKKVFHDYFEEENIIFHDFTDVKSKIFIDIVSQCSFSILPTCSEGQATSLLTTMGAGLIPISTIYSGVDVDKYGFLIKELDMQAMNCTLLEVSQLNNEEILHKSISNLEYINNSHNLISFEKELTTLIVKILNDKK
jgi:hypothetical protein